MASRVLIIGATSAIAQASARVWSSQGCQLFLSGRNPQRLQDIAADLRLRGAGQVETGLLDIDEIDTHVPLVDQAWSALGGVDIALIAHGTLPDQASCDNSVEATMAGFNTNGSSTIAMMSLLANRLQAQGSGTLAVISSVAGERGRASNAVYGAAKAAVTSYASSLRQRFHGQGIQVLTIKPGFVDTPMTRDFAKGRLWVGPDRIARGIVNAVRSKRSVVYLPGFWRLIMLVIRLLPEPLFRRLKL